MKKIEWRGGMVFIDFLRVYQCRLSICCGLRFSIVSIRQNAAKIEEIVLHYIIICACRASRFSHIIAFADGDDDDPRFGEGRFDLTGCSKPVHVFHPDVHQHIIGAMLTVGCQSRRTVVAFVNFANNIFDYLLYHPAHVPAVINYQDFHCLLSARNGLAHPRLEAGQRKANRRTITRRFAPSDYRLVTA